MTCHNQERLMFDVRAGVCNSGPKFHLIEHLEYISFSNTEVIQDYIFMSSALEVNGFMIANSQNASDFNNL